MNSNFAQQPQRKLIEGQPVLVVVDIQGGESMDSGPSAIPFMPVSITPLWMVINTTTFAA